jgi:hypothetical protein
LQRLLRRFCAQVVHARILNPFPSLAQPAPLDVSTSEAPATIKRRGKSTPLTDSQCQQLCEQEGEQLHQIFSRIIDRKGWQSLK